MKNKSNLHTTIDKELLKEIKIIAIQKDINLNQLIELIFKDYLQKDKDQKD